MLRITEQRSGAAVALQLEGRLDHAGVAELDRVAAPAARRGEGLVLDLSGLRSVDREGATCLRRWRQAGAAVRGASPYVERLLEETKP